MQRRRSGVLIGPGSKRVLRVKHREEHQVKNMLLRGTDIYQMLVVFSDSAVEWFVSSA